MSLAPLLDAPPAIPLHALAAVAAFALGIVQFAAPKGTLPHRTVGWIWVGLGSISFACSGPGARSTCCRSSRFMVVLPARKRRRRKDIETSP
jgi:hypothetical protein